MRNILNSLRSGVRRKKQVGRASCNINIVIFPGKEVRFFRYTFKLSHHLLCKMASCSKWFCKRGAGGGEIRTKDMLLLWGSAKKYAYQLAYGAKLPTHTNTICHFIIASCRKRIRRKSIIICRKGTDKGSDSRFLNDDAPSASKIFAYF